MRTLFTRLLALPRAIVTSRSGVRLLHTIASIALVAGMMGLSTTQASAYVCKTYHEQADAYLQIRPMARRTAIQNWSTKVQSQYGLPWSAWSISEGKSVDCKHVDGKWSCVAKAKPCQYVVQ